jgi:hypothetical protein
MDTGPVPRYELTGAPATDLGRYWSAIQLVVSLLLALVVWSIIWSPIFVLIALGSIYGLLHRAKPGWYVELREDGVLVNMLTANRIQYRDIRSADFFVYYLGEPLRAMVNASNSLGRLFGGRSPMFGKKGEVDRARVRLGFRCWRWFYVPFPPFLFPSHGVLLWVDDAPGFLRELQDRISRDPSGPSA